jgi:SAM-dependent methyltransferase
MKAAVREVLRQNIPPESFRRALLWWRYRLYWKGKTASVFINHSANVHGYPCDGSSVLAQEIRKINVIAPTEMCRIMLWSGSDKSLVRHNFTTIYSALFNERRNQRLRIFELGLGTNNPTLVSSMGEYGTPGASLRGWRQLFPNALVYGADIDRDILFEEDRIKTFYCDQLDRDAIQELWSQPDLNGGMDIIIDDGLHTIDANRSFLDASIGHLRPGGIYVIEDILTSTLGQWRDQLETNYSKQFPNCDFALIELPNPINHHDNNLLVIRRTG